MVGRVDLTAPPLQAGRLREAVAVAPMAAMPARMAPAALEKLS